MQIIESAAALAPALAPWRARRIAFVPTMGNLHAGHYALLERARGLADRVVVSIFVNPTQFGAGEDFERYPRTLEADRGGLVARGVDLLYLPQVADIYPFGTAGSVRVHVPGLSDVLCGAARPGHFDGVASVVLRLFNQVRPDLAVFGEKDFQQLLLIRRLVEDLSLGIDIEAGATVREPDGLAMSSRNRYLDREARALAPALYATLRWMAEQVGAGRAPDAVERDAGARLLSNGLVPDYCVIRRADDLAPAAGAGQPLRALAAVRVGSARLIDNLSLM
jgi:pantoate--beta-alanine ligase